MFALKLKDGDEFRNVENILNATVCWIVKRRFLRVIIVKKI